MLSTVNLNRIGRNLKMAKRKGYKKKKLSNKDIIFLLVITVLIIAVLVTLTTNNSLHTLISEYLNFTEDEMPEEVNDEGKFYTSILSGKANFTLPGQFNTGLLLEVHFIDIGQGDAIVINFPDGKTMLIDSGTSTTGLADIRNEYIEYLYDITNDKVIEYMVVTHPDIDHYNMLGEVLDNYCVQNVYYNEDSGTSYTQFVEKLTAEPQIITNLVDSQSVTYIIEGADYKVTIYSCGDSAFDGASERNAMSIICLLEFGGRKVLLTGDAVTATEQWFISKLGDDALDIDVLKVGHHGSDSSTGEPFLDFIDTEYAVISCDDGTKYGHPDETTMERLSIYGIVTYRTNRHGNILLYIDSDGDFGFLTEKEQAVENNTASIDERKIVING